MPSHENVPCDNGAVQRFIDNNVAKHWIVGQWDIECPDPNPNEPFLTGYQVHLERIYQRLEWLAPLSHTGAMQRSNCVGLDLAEIEDELFFNATFESGGELCCFKNAASLSFGREEDGRVLFDLRLFVNVFTHRVRCMRQRTPLFRFLRPRIEVCDNSDSFARNCQILSDGFNRLVAARYLVTAMFSDEIEEITNDGIPLDTDIAWG
ncbi:MAG: hypothetical protein CMJ46_13440 [Planctomyces sp.]|nr:hypothetical protein [Planctomyces sp.]